ncbi:hypothetical protein, partial [Litorisediminicola beolgyonensis]
MIEFAGRFGQGSAALAQDICVLATGAGEGGPVVWAATGTGGGVTAWQLGMGRPVEIDSAWYPRAWSGAELGIAVPQEGGGLIVGAVAGRLLSLTTGPSGHLGGARATDLAESRLGAADLVASAG